MPAFGDRPSRFDPCDDFHGREDHKQEHHYTEGECQHEVHGRHGLESIEGVDELFFIRCFEGEGFQCCAVVIVEGEGIA